MNLEDYLITKYVEKHDKNMPLKITKANGKYKVSTPKGVKAKGTTKAKAEKQAKLLRAVEHGWKPSKKRG